MPTTLSSITADVCIQSIPLLCKMIISAILDDPGLHQIGNITIIELILMHKMFFLQP